MKIGFALLLFSSMAFAQNSRDYYPTEIRNIKTDFSPAFVARYNSEESLKKCEEIWKIQIDNNINFDALSDNDKQSLAYCDEWDGDPWTKQFEGCSWYCGGRIDSVYSSSEKSSSYINDFNFGTAWTSEVKNSKSLPFISFVLKAESSRITNIVFVNGNARSKELFEKYARAKTIKMYVNEIFFGLLHLEDHKNEQIFSFEPIGTANRKDYEAMKSLPNWSIKFEIIDIYEGQINYVAISEVSFEGDGHEDNEE